MNPQVADREQNPPNGMAEAVRKRRDRQTQWRAEGEASLLRFVGQIGILGWIIVVPTLVGMFVGRWLDHRFGTGIFWTAALLVLGVAFGFWSGWRWMHRQ
jgi:ATP synthase protein I